MNFSSHFEHLICHIKHGADISARRMFLRGPAPNAYNKQLMAHLNTYNDKYLAIMCQEKVSMINFQHWTNAQSKAIVCLRGSKIQSESL